jgi:hypothetical protein
VGHKILVAAYHILKGKTGYNELGEEHVNQRQKVKMTRYYQKKLEKLGYKVVLEGEILEKAA